jgi:hypothetical protein
MLVGCSRFDFLDLMLERTAANRMAVPINIKSNPIAAVITNAPFCAAILSVKDYVVAHGMVESLFHLQESRNLHANIEVMTKTLLGLIFAMRPTTIRVGVFQVPSNLSIKALGKWYVR